MIIRYTDNFLHQLKRSDVRIRNGFKKSLTTFIKNPTDASLDNHPLKKPYERQRSIDITGDWRAIYKETVQSYTDGTKEIICYFTFIGTHKDLYK